MKERRMEKRDIFYLIQRKPLEKAVEVLPPNATKEQLWLKSEHYRQLSIKTILKHNPSPKQQEWMLEAIATKPLDADLEAMIDESVKANPHSFTYLEIEARRQQLALREQYKQEAA